MREAVFPDAGHRFGNYVVARQLGRGGLGEVYLAWADGDRRLPRALKVLRRDRQIERFQKAFAAECRVASAIDHPGVVSCHETGTREGLQYLAMEFVDGVDLACLRGTRITANGVAALGASVAAALHAFHGVSNGAAMRDVSPQNIRVSKTGTVKLLDFGQACDPGAAELGEVRGTLGYMSPEQARGLPLDRRADVFSLGVVLHETLTGNALFPRGSNFAAMEAIRWAPIAPPSDQVRGISSAMDAVLARALAREKGQRYSSCDVFAQELRALITDPQAAQAELAALCEGVA